MCHYYEEVLNFRAALLVIEKKVPEIKAILANKASLEMDMDLKIMLMDEKQLEFLYDKYAEVEPRLYQFNPDEEFGIVHTMFDEDMRGD